MRRLTVVAGVLSAALAFGDELTLADAVGLVRSRGVDAALARARLEQFQGRRRSQLAALLPHLEVSASAARFSGAGTLDVVDASKGYIATPVTDPTLPANSVNLIPNSVQTLELQPQVSLTALGQLTVPVLNTAAIARVQTAAQRVEGQAMLVDRAESSAAIRAWQLLLAARASRALVAIGTERLKVAREQEQAAEARFKAGELDRLGLSRAKAATAGADRVLRQLEANEVAARAVLASLLGRDEQFEIGEVAQPPPVEARLMEAAVAHRLDLKAATAFERAAGTDVTASWLRLVPELDASAQYTMGNVQNFTGESRYWVVQARGVWHLFDGGDRYGELREKQGLQSEARLNREAAEREARRQYLVARQQVEASKAALVSAQSEVKFAKDSLEAARAQFRVGQLGYLELLDAQSARFNAEEAQVNETLRLGLARLDLALATGEEASVLEAVGPAR